MKHIKALGKPRPVLASVDNGFWCQLAVILAGLGLPVSKDLVNKCIGF